MSYFSFCNLLTEMVSKNKSVDHYMHKYDQKRVYGSVKIVISV